jgi:hypothetical protein
LYSWNAFGASDVSAAGTSLGRGRFKPAPAAVAETRRKTPSTANAIRFQAFILERSVASATNNTTTPG